MNLLKFSLLFFVSLLAACSPNDEKSLSEANSEYSKSVSLSIKGMVCNGCAESITEAINETPGVITGKVTLNDSTALITFDSTLTNVQALMSVVENTGYTAVPLP